MSDNRCLAVFDSGVGGLTVLKPLMKRFPHENFLYVGDTARLPYGTKSLSTLRNYLLQMTEFLKTEDVKGLVIACHSASSAWLEEPFHFNVPVWEMITPAVGEALRRIPSEGNSLGLLATKATVRSGAYSKALKFLDGTRQIFSRSCPLFVPLIEESMEEDPLTDEIIRRYLSGLPEPCKTLILGCTHYPLILPALRRLYRNLEFIDPAEALVEKVQRDLKLGIWQPADVSLSPRQGLRLLTTDQGSDLWGLARKILPEVEPLHLELVSISAKS